MISKLVLSAFALSAVATAAGAPVSTDSPKDTLFIAKFNQENTNIEGEITFQSDNGSVLVKVDLEELPKVGGPFPYHIHQFPVPSDGNCTGTGGHLNPFNGTTNATTSAGKEVGDLAGKHGNITSNPFTAQYLDDYISLNPKNPAFIGGLSVVIHDRDNKRLACANITAVNDNQQNVTSSVLPGAANLVSTNGLVMGAAVGVAALLI
ncbi:SOD4 [[Candida] subhashii]|uniref:superoxide dismutase n=1 Tax=[Candida] subhashii TaxID=561895 RepID=A0A8J5UJM5_9ASCO|nr:SOD4 [[Candida] subhashii]KAG7664683.1 SOD4 [[Candida] subhashii]